MTARSMLLVGTALLPMSCAGAVPSPPTATVTASPAGGASQTWRWDGARWTEVHPRTVPGVAFGGMAFDGSRPLLFGSAFAAVQGWFLTETWAWDGRLVTALARGAAALSSSYAAARDQARRRVVALVAPPGRSSSETWVWDGTTWSRDQPQDEPQARLGAMAWSDSRTQRVVSYGRLSAGTTTALGDM